MPDGRKHGPLDDALLRLADAPKGRGLRVHEHADCLTSDVLQVLNEKGWIEWRGWVRGPSNPELQLRDGSWSSAFIHWAPHLAEYTGDISPEIRLSRYKGQAAAAEVRLRSGAGAGRKRSRSTELTDRDRERTLATHWLVPKPSTDVISSYSNRSF